MIFQENDFLKTYSELSRMNETLVFEDLKTQRILAKVLGDTIWRTSNYSGQGKKYRKHINFIREYADEIFTGFKDTSFIIAHHGDGNHSHDTLDNIIFIGFEDHSAYTQTYFRAAEEWLKTQFVDKGAIDLNELDFTARIEQINTFIRKLQQEYSESGLMDTYAKKQGIEIKEFPLPAYAGEFGSTTMASPRSGQTNVTMLQELKARFDDFLKTKGEDFFKDLSPRPVPKISYTVLDNLLAINSVLDKLLTNRPEVQDDKKTRAKLLANHFSRCFPDEFKKAKFGVNVVPGLNAAEKDVLDEVAQ
jgi:hypothetical protein